MNWSGIHPVGYDVLVEPREVERVTKGGLHMPDETVEREGFARTEGILVAVSDRAFHELVAVPIGRRVMFNKYNATEVRGRDGKTYWLMKDNSIRAWVEE